MKKTLHICLSSCLLLGGAEAATAEAKPVVINTVQESMNKKYTLVVNGQTLQDRSMYTSQKHLMIPLRSLAEALGYEVKWNQQSKQVELLQGPHWFTMTIGEDRYNFAKMFIELGKAPELQNGRTYVPLPFIEKVLKMAVAVNESGVITVKKATEDVVDLQETTGVITQIAEREDGKKSLTIMGAAASNHGQNYITLRIDEKTEIIDGLTSKPVKVQDVVANMQVQAFYDATLTKSLPPQGYAKRLVVTHTLGKVSGSIREIRTTNDHVQVYVDGGSDQKIDNDVVIGIAKETHILSTSGEKLTKEALQNGKKITAYYGPIMTMSLPPMSTAQTIVVEGE